MSLQTKASKVILVIYLNKTPTFEQCEVYVDPRFDIKCMYSKLVEFYRFKFQHFDLLIFFGGGGI